MAKAILKPLLVQIKQTDDVKAILAKGDVRLNKGKNVISVVDGEGNLIRRKCVYYTGEDSKVQKSMQDETDIKYILEKYGKTGLAPVNLNEAIYGDFSEVPSYQEAQNIMIKAEESFMSLSSDVRKTFDNDPVKFLEFMSDSKNSAEIEKMGLSKPKDKPTSPVKVEVINQTGGSNEGKTN